MSAYDFNHNNQVDGGRNGHMNGGNNQTSTLNTNAIATRQQAGDSEYSSRLNQSIQSPSASGANQLGMSRPTSKTAMLFKQRRSMLEHLSCSICKGYLIDATVVNECMHSFCKSCIIKHLEHNTYCPSTLGQDMRCGRFIDRSDSLSIRPDKVLQSIVYKLIPGLYDDEMQKRREFYGLDSSSSDEDESDTSSNSTNGRDTGLGDERSGIMPHPKPFYKQDDQIDISIEPQTMGDSPIVYFDDRRQSLITRIKPTQQSHKQQQIVKEMFSVVDSQQYKSYLRCPAMLTVLQLKKLITAKFNVGPEDTLQLRYINDTLKDEYSLIDIAYIYDWRGNDHMRMFYVIERDISKITYQYESQNAGRSSAMTRQNSAMSTQTVKRVCIDPKPRFYEEPSDKRMRNDQNNNSRLTRSRGDVSVGTNQVVRKPMIKTSGTSTVTNSDENHKINGNKIRTTATTNGMANRDIVSSQTRSNPQSSFRSSASKASNSTSTEDELKETRASKKLATPANVPKFNNNLRFIAEPNTTSVGFQNGSTREQSASSSGSRQLVPYVGPKGFQSAAAVEQASMVTLASFTAARSSQIMTVSTATTSAGTVTNSYKNMINSSSSHKIPAADINIRPEPRTSQLAIRIVTTKQGYTISKPLGGTLPSNNSINSSTNSTSSNARSNISAGTGSLPAISAVSQQSQPSRAITSSSSSSATSSNHQNNISNNTVSNHHHSANAISFGPGNNNHATSRQDGQDGQPSGRHLAKQKPVYKTLVDPSKVKPPNFKRH